MATRRRRKPRRKTSRPKKKTGCKIIHMPDGSKRYGCHGTYKGKKGFRFVPYSTYARRK